jgi:subtilisin family serine protease
MRALIDNVRFFDKLGSFAGSAAAFGRSALIIGASGNTSHRRRKRPIVLRAEFPSAAENFISAGAVEQTADVSCPFRVAEFSNAGANVCGPGVDILSAVPGEPRGRLESWSGTSMATPHVAGVATLWAHKLMLDEGPVSASTIAFNLLKHARRFQGLEQDDVGDGLVQSP